MCSPIHAQGEGRGSNYAGNNGHENQIPCIVGEMSFNTLCRCSSNLANKYWWILVLSDGFLGLNQVCAPHMSWPSLWPLMATSSHAGRMLVHQHFHSHRLTGPAQERSRHLALRRHRVHLWACALWFLESMCAWHIQAYEMTCCPANQVLRKLSLNCSRCRYLFGAVMPLVAAAMTTHYTPESPFYLMCVRLLPHYPSTHRHRRTDTHTHHHHHHHHHRHHHGATGAID